jgi:hypothetical protein
MRLIGCLVVLAVAMAFGGCGAYRGPSGDKHPYTNTQFASDPQDFHFAFVSDRNGGMRPGVFETAIGELNLLRPEFVICVGDLIAGYTQKPDELAGMYDEVDGMLGRLEVPFFRVAGNHDITNKMAYKQYLARYGQAYYHFVYKDTLFVVLNTQNEGVAPSLGQAQIDDVRKTLAENRDVRWTFVIMHQPIWAMGENRGPTSEWLQVEEMLRDRSYSVYAGHWHTYERFERHGRAYYALATTGAKSSLAGPELGEFDHISWVTMTRQGPLMANLRLDGIYTDAVSTEQSLAQYKALLKDTQVLADPLYATGESFAGATRNVRLVNGTSQPVIITGQATPGALAARPAEFRVELAAHSEQNVPIEVKATRAAAVDSLEPIEVKYVYEYPRAGQKAFRVEQAGRLGVAQAYDCPRASGPVVVDGKLDDWKELPIDVKQPRQIGRTAAKHKGTDDCRFRLATCYDDQYLYVAVQVFDDKVVVDAGKFVWEQDGVEIRLDGRPDPERYSGKGDGEWEKILPILVSPGEKLEPAVLWTGEKLPAGTKVACVKTATGYNTEVAIPLAYLNAQQGGAWKAFRLNVAVDDLDSADAGAPSAQLWWYPDWRSQQTLDGSGTFMKK